MAGGSGVLRRRLSRHHRRHLYLQVRVTSLPLRHSFSKYQSRAAMTEIPWIPQESRHDGRSCCDVSVFCRVNTKM